MRPADGVFSWRVMLRSAALVAVLLVMLWLGFNVRLPSADALQEWVGGFGWAGGLAFASLYALVGLTPIPISIMSLSAGLLFGIPLGSAMSVIGAIAGCLGAYWIARALGKPAVLRLLGSHAPRVEKGLQGAGFIAVAALRLVPGVPYWPVNYGSGVFGVSQRDYLFATAMAIIPGQVSLVAVGSFIAAPHPVSAVVAAIGWTFSIGMAIWAYRAWRRLRRVSSGAEADS